MASYVKKLFHHDNKPAKAAPQDRGKTTNDEEKRKWLRENEFTKLPKQGQEAFFRYLCGDVYPEDKDICDVDPKAAGMNTKSRQYQFWLKCEQLELLKLFEDYISDEDTRLPEVDECFDDVSRSSEEKDFETFLSTKKEDAGNTQSFISALKSKMKQKLDTCFVQFKDDLKEHLT